MTEARAGLVNHGLLALVVLGWSTSWIALKAQTGVVAPEVSVFWRFALAAPLTFLYAQWRGARLDFPLAAHAWFLLFGMLIFSTNFIVFYHGALYLASGLLSVVFSLASLINLLLGRILFGERLSGRVALGGVLGAGGVALMFLPEFARAPAGAATGLGLALCLAGTLTFCFGNMVAARLQRDGLPVIGASAWGMLYGAIWSGLLALGQGATFAVEWTWPYLGGLLYLATVSSVLAFLTYLTLLGRVGAARAGYATVIFPVIALMISALFEGYSFTIAALGGLGLVAAGNVLVLRR